MADDTEFTDLINTLPTGASFAFLRMTNKIYVDKTDQVFALASVTGGCYFLSRPRRFGKSTLVNTLQELFEHGTQPYDGHASYFKGLAIDGQWQEKPGACQVVHWDFSACHTIHTANQWENDLMLRIGALAERLNIQIKPEYKNNFTWMIKDFLQKAEYSSLVLLIDEYDAPLIYARSTEEIKAFLAVMQNFYAIIKSYSEKFRFIFITGVLGFRATPLFREGNFIRDISQNPLFADICGYSTEDLKTHFAAHLRYAAAVRNNTTKAQISTADTDKLAAEMTQWYGGFYFAEDAASAVLSTWSVLSFFNNPRYSLTTYWNETWGDFNELMRKKLLKENLLTALRALTANEALDVSRSDFNDPSTLDRINVYVLLFQTGYLTFKAGIGLAQESSTGIFPLCMPNKEAAASLPKLMARAIFSDNGWRFSFAYYQLGFIKAVQAADLDQICCLLTELLQPVDYKPIELTGESIITALTGFFILSCGFSVRVNEHQLSGSPALRADSRSLQKSLILEFRCSSSDREEDLNQSLQQALEQLKSRQYSEPLCQYPDRLRLALVYSSVSRQFARAALAD
ncbi:MAG: AAA family ATPase [Proteobacteria bacterium]|uniref:AAA family ATPase n=1 Tax=Candidatus Avisuccinivibrio stercorigallinarum TaxID=2840704 RepID=A0A9D9DB23_9GAMM|nr:AAA family ATPase [Candidatus Avisuccinivibrio stercorigallinarum]